MLAICGHGSVAVVGTRTASFLVNAKVVPTKRIPVAGSVEFLCTSLLEGTE